MHAMDVRTLLLLTALLLVSRSVLLAYVWHKVRGYKPVRWWAAGSALIALGVLLVGLRDVVPDFLSVLVGQGCIIFGWAGTSVGTLMAADREPPWRLWWWLSLASIASAAWFFFAVPDYAWRTIAVSLPGMVFDAYVVWACFRYRADNRRRGTLKVLGSVTLAAMLSVLAKNIHVVHSQSSSLLAPAWEVSLYVLITILTLTACTVLYVLLAAEDTQDDLDLEIHERERAAESMRLATLVFHTTDEGMIVTAADGTIVNVNPAFSVLTGYAPHEAMGRTPRMLKSDRHDPAFFAAMWRTLGEQGKWQGEIWNRHKDGHEYAVRIAINTLRHIDGSVQCHVALLHDITHEKLSAEKIFHQANHDRLTGLANRYAFFERLANELSRARRAGTHVGLLFMDLNRFKPVNDLYGHEAGDTVLRTVAERWVAMVRDTDTLARMGGDEFALLLGDLSSPDEAGAVAQKLLRALDAWIELPDGKRCQVGTSIGIATYPGNAAEMDSLIAAADAAMYGCKAGGDGGYAMSSVRCSGVAAGADWVVFEDIHRVGVAEIDHQHMQLVAMVNNINRAVVRGKSDAELRVLFGDLIRFAVEHFATEHRYMTTYGYPEQANHDQQHEQLAGQLVEIFNRFEPGDEIRMLQTTKDWLMGHIMNADKQMGIYLQARGVT